MIELRGISKYFPANEVMALKNADFTLRPAETHALLGENGTGKSTLMHILAGYFSPSSGSIFVDGKERCFSASADALATGIGMVRQHPGFVRGFKVWEDCILGAERQAPIRQAPRPFCNVLFDPGKSKKRVEEICRLWGFDLPLDKKAESLTVSQRQKAAVLALLLRDVKWFIFDEPTAVLTQAETKTLFELLNRLRKEGRGIVLITHKLDEALTVSDRITVIRTGVTQAPKETKGLSIRDLNSAIFSEGAESRDLGTGIVAEKHYRVPTHSNYKQVPFSPLPPPSSLHSPSSAIPILHINNLHLAPPGPAPVRNVNLQLMPGKITGITGVSDAGLETLEHAVTGLLRYVPVSGGAITLNGHNITAGGVRAFRDAGGAYLGADRLGKNLATGLPLKESLVIHAFRRVRSGIFLDMAYLNSWCRNVMDKAGITRSVSDKTTSFSGGMLQRILLAREFAENASLLVLAEPGSGLDKLNREKLEDELRAFAEKGAAVLLFSSDMEQLTSVADEIMVLSTEGLSAVNRYDKNDN